MKRVLELIPATAAIAASFLVVTLGNAPRAHAGGLEIPAPGTQALGRGGAFVARADDPMALYYNPANLADLSGIQLTLQSHLIFYNACFERTGTYGGDARGDVRSSAFGSESAFGTLNTVGEMPLPRVCNSGPVGPTPELILTWRVLPQLGLSIGLVSPAAVGHTVWGEDTTRGGRTYRGTTNELPSPSRYNLVEEQLLIAFPTIGAGYSPHPRVRLGLAFGSGFGLFSFDTVTRAGRGEEFSGDVFSELSASDKFIPRITASVHVVPHDNLDVTLGFIWTDDVRAEGDLKLTTGYYRETPLEELTIPGVILEAPQPWQAYLGIRYADRITPRTRDANAASRVSGRVEDKMSNERWDIEVDIQYEYNSRVDAFVANLPRCDGGPSCAGDRWQILATDGFIAPLPPDIILPHQWKDQLSLRIGGDYNIVPGLIAARLGFSYETRGVSEGFEQLDFLPFQRFGLHAGATVRLGNFDISIAYAHLFQSTVTVTEDEAQIRQVSASARIEEIACGDDPDCEPTTPGTIINAGRYTSRYDLVSLGLTYHFQ